jgi:hypothetical protein
VRQALPALLLAVSSVAAAQTDPLATRPGWEIGGQVAHYNYQEPNFAELSGYRLGIVGSGTYVNPTGVFARVDFRASYGSLDYTGSGTMSGVPDLILETRGVVGADLIGKSVSLAPYLGLGYRYLYDDLRGYSSTNSAGYQRYSNYVYLPVGFTVRVPVSGGWVFAPMLEGDVFLSGRQISKLSEVNTGLADVTNHQSSGRGWRFSLMFEKDHWAFGAWGNYWHIQDSDLQPIGGGKFGLEPENFTREYGLELRYRF